MKKINVSEVLSTVGVITLLGAVTVAAACDEAYQSKNEPLYGSKEYDALCQYRFVSINVYEFDGDYRTKTRAIEFTRKYYYYVADLAKDYITGDITSKLKAFCKNAEEIQKINKVLASYLEAKHEDVFKLIVDYKKDTDKYSSLL